MLCREPKNKYDSNAVQVSWRPPATVINLMSIEVLNGSGVQVGHIPRGVAEKLAPLMDAQQITVEGRMIAQNVDGAKHYKLAMNMSIYARPSLRDVLEPKLGWATPNGEGFEEMRRQAQAEGKTLDDPRLKGKGKGLAPTGIHGIGGSAGIKDPQILKLLDGLHKVGEDEKHADMVMVRDIVHGFARL